MKQTICRAAILAVLAVTSPAGAHDDDAAPAPLSEALGSVEFGISCNAEAQREFNRAMALYHSFWFDPASEAFRAVARHDPQCGMAYWGLALSSQFNPYAVPSPEALRTGATFYRQAVEVGAKTQRERDYIAALGGLFKDHETAAHRDRILAWEQGMERLARAYPEDGEAQILYALTLAVSASPTDKTYAKQLRAAAILEPIFRERSDHPGVAHYLIHTYDAPGLVERGLPAAQRYAAIAPSAPHAQHMPGHIFTRLGMWDESIRTNAASVRAATKEYEAGTPVGIAYTFHAADYLTFAYLQRAQDRKAKELVDRVNATDKVNVAYLSTPYAIAAIPARYAIERRAWDEAAALPVRQALLSWDRYPQAEAVTVYARALGAARSARPESARGEIERLKALQAALGALKQEYWAQQTDIQIAAASAWLVLAEGRADEALASMRRATALEEATDKHPVTPGLLVPARELLGEMLLELGRPGEALAEFERVQAREPNRFRGFYNAGLAAERTGDTRKAVAHYDKLLGLTAQGDSARPELAHARARLATAPR